MADAKPNRPFAQEDPVEEDEVTQAPPEKKRRTRKPKTKAPADDAPRMGSKGEFLPHEYKTASGKSRRDN